MESNGAAGRINISEKTKELLEAKFSQNFSFEFNKEVFLPNVQKSIPSYFVDLNC